MWIASSGCATAVIGSSKLTTRPIRYTPAACASRAIFLALKYGRAAPSFSAIAGAPLRNETLPLSSFRSTSTVFRPSRFSARYSWNLPGSDMSGPVMCTPRISSGSGVRNALVGAADATGVSAIAAPAPEPERRRVSPKSAAAPSSTSTVTAVRRRRRTWRRLISRRCRRTSVVVISEAIATRDPGW